MLNGKPVPKAQVTVSWGREDWDFVRSRDMKDAPGDNGVYRVPYVRAGRFSVWVNGPGGSLGACDNVEVGPKNPEPEAVVTLDLAVLTIRVVDAKANPVPGVDVRIENADDEKGMPGFTDPTNHRGEVWWSVEVHRWRVRIQDANRGTGEWVIAKPEVSEDKLIVLTLPASR